MSDKILQNPMAVKHLAQRLRQQLSEGYSAGSRFREVLAKLSDEDLVRQYLAKRIHHRNFPQAKASPAVVLVQLIVLVLCLGMSVAGCKETDPAWRPLDKPQETFRLNCVEPSGPDCFFVVKGFWRSTSANPKSELAWPTQSSINCDKFAKSCTETYAYVDDAGRLGSDSTEFKVSLWTHEQIIATTIQGLCDIGNQLTVDVPNQTVMRRTYPTKVFTDGVCSGAFSETNTYVLRGGDWTLQPVVGKKF
jgi:hypothetical protein